MKMGAAWDLTGADVLRGEATGWGIIDPPRLEGGVTNAFAEYPDGGTKRVEAAFGGVDEVS